MTHRLGSDYSNNGSPNGMSKKTVVAQSSKLDVSSVHWNPGVGSEASEEMNLPVRLRSSRSRVRMESHSPHKFLHRYAMICL